MSRLLNYQLTCSKLRDFNGVLVEIKRYRGIFYGYNGLKRWKLHMRHQFPNDWLPFHWEYPVTLPFFLLGDKEQTMSDFDPKHPRVGYEKSKELENAPPLVKKLFSLGMGNRHDLVQHKRAELQKKLQRNPWDESSPEYMIAKYTVHLRIAQERIRGVDQDNGLAKMKTRGNWLLRQRQLNKLYKNDKDKYKLIINMLDIEHTPCGPGPLIIYKIKRRDELKRLTEDYAENLRKQKLDDYHNKLKDEQKSFLEEKEKTRKWIEDELRLINTPNESRINE